MATSTIRTTRGNIQSMGLGRSMNTFRFKTLLLVLLGVTPLFCQTSVWAHNLGQSYVYLKIFDEQLTGRFEIVLDDLNKALLLDQTGNLITTENLPERLSEVQAYISSHLAFEADGEPLEIRYSGFETLKAKGVFFALLDFTLIDNRPTPDAIDIDYSIMFDVAPEHSGMVLIEQFWRGQIFNNESRPSLIFSDTNRSQQLDLSSYSMLSAFLGIVKLGIKHILLGIDHILFLIALILPAAMIRKERHWQPVGKFRSAFFYVIKIVTLFTIAHTLTLSLASLQVIDLPPRLVESVIALSIAVAALDILYPIFNKKIGWVVFIFGLFHGFGFASVLSHLGVLGEHMALSLFGFNLGVEIGQVAVILVIFPILYMIRRHAFFPRVVLRYGAVVLIMLSAVWFFERAIPDSPFKNFVVTSITQLIS
jgi:hypothetical protein